MILRIYSYDTIALSLNINRCIVPYDYWIEDVQDFVWGCYGTVKFRQISYVHTASCSYCIRHTAHM